ncbi:MAG: endolytic transglycosylase MltG [Rhodoglobus sp.]
MANEPSWDELFNSQSAQPQSGQPESGQAEFGQPQPGRPYSVDSDPVSAVSPQADDDPFAALFGALNTGQTPAAPSHEAAVPPADAPSTPVTPPEWQSAQQQPAPVQQSAPPAWPAAAESAPADPLAGLFGNPPARAPLVEPPAPQVNADPFAAAFAAPRDFSSPVMPPSGYTAAPVADPSVPLTRRELREREALGGGAPAPQPVAPTSAPVAAAGPAATAAIASRQDDFFASLSAAPGGATRAAPPAPTPAAPSSAEGVFPFDFAGARGGSNGGSSGGYGGGGGDRSGEPKKKRSLLWLKITLPIVIVLGLLGGGAAYVWFNYESQVRELLGWQLPNDFEGAGNGEEVIVTIQSGDLGSDIASTLHDSGVTMTFDAFYELLLAQPENVNFLPGNYALQKQMSAQSALDALLDPANKVTSKLLITEGTTLTSALEIISETTGIPLADVQAAAADPTVYGVPAGEPSLEGYLFPATYELDGSETAQDILQLLVTTMFEHLDAAGVAPDDRHRVLTMASIIQREAGSNQDDFYKISRVFQNRIEQGINLESDATVAYGTGNLQTVWTTDEERADASNLYNTYANPGLPIGPIGLPGDLAIDAALKPADGPWLFFVPINLATGETVFSETVDEHEAAVAVLRAWCDESAENASYCE